MRRGTGGARPAHTRSPGLGAFASPGSPPQLHPGLRRELSGLDALFSRWQAGGGWLWGFARTAAATGAPCFENGMPRPSDTRHCLQTWQPHRRERLLPAGLLGSESCLWPCWCSTVAGSAGGRAQRRQAAGKPLASRWRLELFLCRVTSQLYCAASSSSSLAQALHVPLPRCACCCACCRAGLVLCPPPRLRPRRRPALHPLLPGHPAAGDVLG